MNKVEYRLIKFASQLNINEQKIKIHEELVTNLVYGVYGMQNDRLDLTIILLLKKILKSALWPEIFAKQMKTRTKIEQELRSSVQIANK